MQMLKAAWNDERGNTAILFALGSTLVCGVVGGALDFGRAYSARTKMQAAVDAAALAGAQADPSARIATATTVFNNDFPGVTPVVTVNGGNVSVSGNSTVPTTLVGVLGFQELPVKAAATAGSLSEVSTTGTWILLLHPSDIGLYVNSDSKLDANCGLHVNSSHSTEALFANSFSHITTTSTSVKGEARLNSGSTASPAPVEGGAVKSDPLATLAEPSNANAACNHTDYKVENGQIRTLLPGVYCKTTLINSGGTAFMQPGTYIFRGGEFVVNSNSTVIGTQVTMFFADKDARLNVNSDSTFNATAPSSGMYQGILVFQGRASANSGAAPFIVNSLSSTRLQGTIYLPQGTLEVNSHSTSNQLASYTAIIAQKMVLNSFGTLTVNWDTSSSTPLPPLLASAVGTTKVWLTQ